MVFTLRQTNWRWKGADADAADQKAPVAGMGGDWNQARTADSRVPSVCSGEGSPVCESDPFSLGNALACRIREQVLMA